MPYMIKESLKKYLEVYKPNDGEYTKKVQRLLEELVNNENIEITEIDLINPLSEEEFDQMAKKHIPSLQDDYKELFFQIGGIAIRWESKKKMEPFSYYDMGLVDRNDDSGEYDRKLVQKKDRSKKFTGHIFIYDFTTVTQAPDGLGWQNTDDFHWKRKNSVYGSVYSTSLSDKAGPLEDRMRTFSYIWKRDADHYTSQEVALLLNEKKIQVESVVSVSPTTDEYKYSSIPYDKTFNVFAYSKENLFINEYVDKLFLTKGIDGWQFLPGVQDLEFDPEGKREDWIEYARLFYALEQLFPDQNLDSIKHPKHDEIITLITQTEKITKREQEINEYIKESDKKRKEETNVMQKLAEIQTTTFTNNAPKDFADDYVKSFKAVVNELGEHPNIKVHVFKTTDGATEDDFADAEKNLGTLSKELKEFYKQTNGLQLVWELIPEGEESLFDKYAKEELLEDGSIRWGDPYFDDSFYNVVMLMPLHKIENFSEAKVTIKSKELDLKVIDRYQTWHDVAVVLDKDTQVGDLLVLGEDQGANYNEYNPFTKGFEAYLHYVLATRGASVLRSDIFQNEDHKYTKEVPNLSAVLSEVVKEK